MFSVLTRPLRSTLSLASAPVFSAARQFSLASTTSSLSLLRRQQITPTSNPTSNPSSIASQIASLESNSVFSNVLSLGGQRRWKSRGNSYQPNTYKRKKTLGFMSRMRSKSGRKIIARRREKGRWYLSY